MNRFISSHDLLTMTKHFTTDDDGSFARSRTIGWDPAAIGLVLDCNAAFSKRKAFFLRLHTKPLTDLHASLDDHLHSRLVESNR